MADNSLKARLARSKGLTPEFFVGTIAPSGTEPNLVFLRGPLTLCRFGRVNFGEMQCWFTHEEYGSAVAKADEASASGGSHSSTLREVLRDRLAIRLDWNDMGSLSFLHLPDGVGVEAFKSLVKAQPLVSAHDASTSSGVSRVPVQVPFLRGGGVQYWLIPQPAWLERRPRFLKGG